MKNQKTIRRISGTFSPVRCALTSAVSQTLSAGVPVFSSVPPMLAWAEARRWVKSLFLFINKLIPVKQFAHNLK